MFKINFAQFICKYWIRKSGSGEKSPRNHTGHGDVQQAGLEALSSVLDGDLVDDDLVDDDLVDDQEKD
jgi:hypothetical protein